VFPDLDIVRNEANDKCMKRRKGGLGFHWNWEYDRKLKRWYTRKTGKSIGSACESFLFHIMLRSDQWSDERDITHDVVLRKDTTLSAGFYDLTINNWKLENEVRATGRLGNIPKYFHPNFNAGPYCDNSETFDWHIDDATHII
jgi:hypothetical protein